MDTTYTQRPSDDLRAGTTVVPVPDQSAVAWCAVFAGAVASASLSLILLFLGTGLGLTMVSPWAGEGVSATTWGVTTIVGITFISLIASAVGGYMAGRLRTRWATTPRDEVHFRDTAHGFLSWSIATLGTAALLTGVTGTIVTGGVKAGAEVAGGAMHMTSGAAAIAMPSNNDGDGNSAAGENGDANQLTFSYLVDTLLRPDSRATTATAMPSQSVPPESFAPEGGADPSMTSPPAPRATTNQTAQPTQVQQAEIARIYMNGIAKGSLPESDRRYVAQRVAEATGVDQATAEQRVAETFATLQTTLQEAETSARKAAETAREVSATASLWLFVSLLIGAFIASLMAVYGGRQRDLY